MRIDNFCFASAVFIALVAVYLPTELFAQQTPSPDNRDLTLSQNVYSDPNGFFKMRPPDGWYINEYPSDTRGKVDFNSSNTSSKAQLKIIGQTSPFSNFSGLLTDCRNGAERMRARIGGTSSVKEISKFNVKAVEIRFDVPGKFKQLQIQVLLGKNYYMFAFGGPPDQFDRHEKVVLRSIDTFEPLFKESSGSDAVSHIIISKIRTAELYLSIGRKDWALVVVDEGLELDKQNKKLLELKDKCLK
jgi:hypothetical protein